MTKFILQLKTRESILNDLVLNETVNEPILNNIITSKQLHTYKLNTGGRDEKQQLIEYKNRLKKGVVSVQYKRDPLVKFGRVLPHGGIGLFNMRRAIRHTLTKDAYTDIDIVNCHPVLLVQICEANDIKVKYLKRYVDNRDTYLEWVQTNFKVDRDAAKALFITLLYFGSIEGWAKKYNVKMDADSSSSDLDKLQKEIKNIGYKIESCNDEIKKDVENKKFKQNKENYNKTGSILSFFLQEYENIVLEEVYKYSIEHGYIKNNNGVLCADGLMIPKENYKSCYLDELKQHIKEKTGFDLEFKEKLLNEGLTLENNVINTFTLNDGLGVFNDMEAAQVVFNNFKHWVCCNSVLFVFDELTGLWSSDEQAYFKIINKFDDVLFMLKTDKKGCIAVEKKGYGNSTTLQRQMIPQLKTLCINNDWLRDSENSSLKKLLFLNGYLNLPTGEFITTFNPEIVFFNRIQLNYDPSIIDINYVNSIKQRLFNDTLGDTVGQYFLLSLARGIAGDIMKKIIFGLGSTNGGKSTVTKAFECSFGDYVGNFNAENLAYKTSSTDEAAKLRWCMLLRFKRLIFSNEIKSTVELNGNEIKKISSGGDALTARVHGGLETRFTPHFLTVVMANDIPKITPYDDAVNNRVNVVSFSKQFVDEPVNEFQLKKDANLDEEIKTTKFKIHFIHLLVNAYLEFQKGGRVDITPNEVINAKNDWIGDEADFSVMGKFLNEYEITNNENDFITSSNLQHYIEELKAGVSFKKFSVELKKYCLLHSFLLVLSKNKKLGGKAHKVWTGIRIRVEDDEPDTNRDIKINKEDDADPNNGLDD